MHDLPHLFMAHQYGIQNGMFVECKLVLVQHRHTFTGGDLHRSLVRLDLTTDDLHKSGFPGAIGTNDPIAVTLGEMEVDVVEQNPFP